jgi:hypothetical protein
MSLSINVLSNGFWEGKLSLVSIYVYNELSASINYGIYELLSCLSISK